MKKFNVPRMEVKRFEAEDVLTGSGCTTEALGCTSCYCTAVACGETYNPQCPGCYNDLGDF